MATWERGSEWRKWDLHTHTPASFLNNQFPRLDDRSPDWEQYLTALEATDLAVLGVTDYFTIDGYKKLLQFKKDGRLANISCLLPNIEFRLDKVLSSRHDSSNPRRLNFHVIFSDELPPDIIEEHFLFDLEFDYEANPQAPGGTRKLKRSNIADLGNRLAEEHAPFAGQDPLELGASKIMVSQEKIVRALEDDRFRGKYLIALPEELSSLMDWDGQDHLVRKLALQQSDLVFSANPRTREWCLGRPPYEEGEAKFLEEFKSLKPCVHGSDAHSLGQINRPCAKRSGDHQCTSAEAACEMRYLWIKADPTFEGLKQLVCEPDDRVRIQERNPDPMRGGYTLDRFSIDHAQVSEELTIRTEKRVLSSGLVAVCGGRGAGKTAFVDLLANSFVDRTIPADPNSFVQRVVGPGVEIATEVHFRNGETFRKKLMDGKRWENSDVVYIPQGQLEQHLGDGSALEDYVNELVFGSPTIKNSVLHYDYLGLAENVTTWETELGKLCDRMVELEQATTGERREANRTALAKATAAASDLEQQIQTLQSSIDSDKVNLAEAEQLGIEQWEERLQKHEELRRVLNEVRIYLQSHLPTVRSHLARANVLLHEFGIGELSDLSYNDFALIDRYLTEVDRLIKPIVAGLQGAQTALEGREADVRRHAKLLERLRAAKEAVAALDVERKKIQEQQAELQKRLSERDAAMKALLGAVLDQRDKYSEMVAAFANQKAGVLTDLDFVPEITFDAGTLVSRIDELIDGRRVKDIAGTLSSVLSTYEVVAGGDRDAIGTLVDELARRADELGGLLRQSYLVNRRAFYSVLYSNPLCVTPKVRYKNIGLSKLSLGQKATVLMKIYLAEGTKPIIIDSHDDHLDNQYIMDELISAVRQAKIYRQVILVSNNANVVINSDAEQIVVASHQEGEISYASGAIENRTIREQALTVLEGGPDAFRRRQRKYRIQPDFRSS